MAGVRGHTYTASSTLTVTVNLPAETQVGDTLLLIVAGYFESDTTGKPSTTFDLIYSVTDFTDWRYMPPFDAFDFAEAFDPDKTFEAFACVKYADAGDLSAGTVSFTTLTNNGLYALCFAVDGVTLDPYMVAFGDYYLSDPPNPENFTYGSFPRGVAIGYGFWMHDGSTPVNPGISVGDAYFSHDDGTAAVLATTQTLTRWTIDNAFSGDWTGAAAADAVGWVLLPIYEPVSNDAFANAETVTIGDVSPTQPFNSGIRYNTGYSTETGEPLIGGSNTATGKSAWWKYQPIDDGTAAVSTHTSAYLVIDVFEGSTLTGLTHLASNVTSVGGDGTYTFTVGAIATTTVTAGHTYYVRTATWPAINDDTLTYQLSVDGPVTTTAVLGLVVDAPPAQTAVTALPQSPAFTNDAFAIAETVTIATDNATFTSAGYDNSDYTVETSEPHTTATSFNLRRTAWWKYSPRHSGTVTFTTAGSTPAEGLGLDLELHVYTGAALSALTEVASGNTIDSLDTTARTTFYAYAGHTYYIQIGDASGQYGSATAVLTAQGPGTVGDPTMAVDAPTITTAVTDTVIAPVQLAAGNPTPADGAVLPTTRPTFTLTVFRGESEPVDVTVTLTIGLAGDVTVATVSKTVTLSFTTNTVALTAPADLTPGTAYFWKVQVSYGGQLRFDYFWKPFTVASTDTTTTSVPITWTVTGGTPAPHLWFVHPAAGKPGDHITAIGHGASAGTVTVNGTAATLVSFNQTAATSASTGRVINPYTGVVDAEHFTAVFTVPDIGAPGGPVVIAS